jgi:integrase
LRGRTASCVPTRTPAATFGSSNGPPNRDPSFRALNADAALAILDALRDTEVGSITELAAYTGLRLGEALGLPWASCDLDDGVLWVEQVAEQCLDNDGRTYARLRGYPKADGSIRDVPLPPQAIALLRRLKATYNAKLLAAGMTPAADHLVFSNLNISRARRGLPMGPVRAVVAGRVFGLVLSARRADRLAAHLVKKALSSNLRNAHGG